MGSRANSGRVLPLDLVMRCERLLVIRSVAAVADELGLDSATVRKIDRGSHPQQRMLRALVRCPDCGGLVEPPCGLCLTRHYISERLSKDRKQAFTTGGVDR